MLQNTRRKLISEYKQTEPKYLGGESVSGEAVHVWHFFLKKSVFLKRIAGLGLFGSD